MVLYHCAFFMGTSSHTSAQSETGYIALSQGKPLTEQDYF